MFDWLKRLGPESSGTQSIMRNFGQMLEDGRHIFDAASNALLGGTDPAVIQDDLWATDKRINHTERKIRRKIVIHGAIHGARELPICLTMMSIVKDAERIGDYGKNIFDVAKEGVPIPEPHHADLVDLKDTISRLLVKARNIYSSQNEDDARAFLTEADQLQTRCDDRLSELLKSEASGAGLAASALTYRFFKRVVAHLLNVITSIVVPIDQLDYYDEAQETRDEPPA